MSKFISNLCLPRDLHNQFGMSLRRLGTVALIMLISTGCLPLEEKFKDPHVAALAEAGVRGELAEIERLISEGVDVNASTRSGRTPLLMALEAENREGYLALLKGGADPNMLTREGVSVMHRSAQHHDTFWLRQALEHGGAPNLINHGNRHYPNSTPLFYALVARAPGQSHATSPKGLVENTKLLIAAGADVNHVDYHDQTPLRVSGQGILSNYETTLALLKAGADYRRVNRHGFSYIDYISGGIRARDRIEPELKPWFYRVVRFLAEEGVQLDEMEKTLEEAADFFETNGVIE